MSADANISKERSNESLTDFLSSKIEDYARLVVMYYEHQYDRMAKLEEQRLTISNIVLGISTIALTFGLSSSQRTNAISGIGLPITMVAVNIFAILHFRRSMDHIAVHQARAKRALELYAPDIYKLDQSIKSRPQSWERWKLQVFIHVVLICVAFLAVGVYLQSVI